MAEGPKNTVGDGMGSPTWAGTRVQVMQTATSATLLAVHRQVIRMHDKPYTSRLSWRASRLKAAMLPHGSRVGPAASTQGCSIRAGRTQHRAA